jgi:hypothetical protein
MKDSAQPVVQLSAPVSSTEFKAFEVIPIYSGYNVSSWKVVCLTQYGGIREACFSRDELNDEKLTERFCENSSIATDKLLSDDLVQRIDYLEQCNLLLVQLLENGTVGLQLEHGEVVRSTSLLSNKPLTSETTSVEVTGPYTHWHSFKCDDFDSASLSLLCIGKIAGSSDSVLVQMSMGNVVSITFTRLTGSVQGSALSVLPVIENSEKPFNFSMRRRVFDRVILCAISSGCLTTMIESGAPADSLSLRPERAVPFLFEDLIKVSQPDRLFFHVDGIR